MDWKMLGVVAVTAFISELGDKSQALTLLYVSGKQASPWLVFLGISLALVTATGIGVLAGSALAQFISEKILSWVAGAGFLLIGILTLVRASQLS